MYARMSVCVCVNMCACLLGRVNVSVCDCFIEGKRKSENKSEMKTLPI